MIQHPAVIALIVSSLTISCMALYAAWCGLQILLKWDLNSGSELQLGLERRTYLISTILAYALLFQILSLFLFIYTAEDIHTLFTGAMCAAGTLNADVYGYPTLLLKVFNCILAGVWLIINYADVRGYDYPLIKAKYTLLMVLAPLMVLEALVQFGYFSGLRADVITSCCGSLFSADRPNVAGELAALPHSGIVPAFYGCIAATVLCGAVFILKGRGGYLFSVMSGLSFVVCLAALISSFCLYFYELPTHHCPFCILQKEYGYAGYALYASLLGGVVAGTGVGALMPFRGVASLRGVIPGVQRRLTVAAVLLYLLFAAIVTYRMLTSSLVIFS